MRAYTFLVPHWELKCRAVIRCHPLTLEPFRKRFFPFGTRRLDGSESGTTPRKPGFLGREQASRHWANHRNRGKALVKSPCRDSQGNLALQDRHPAARRPACLTCRRYSSSSIPGGWPIPHSFSRYWVGSRPSCSSGLLSLFSAFFCLAIIFCLRIS